MAFWPDRGSGVNVEPARRPVQSAIRQYFTEGGAGQAPTVPGGDWFNQMTNEVLNVLAAAGIEPSKVDDDQLTQAINLIASNAAQSVRTEFERFKTANPAYVDSYKTGAMTDTDAIDAAMLASKHVVFSDRKYTYTKPLISIGHLLEGTVGETFSSTGTIIEFDIEDTPDIPFAYRNTINKGYVGNIRFIQKSWSCELNGCRIDRKVSLFDCDFSYFNGYGVVLESVDAEPRSCYGSSLVNLHVQDLKR